LKRIDEVYIAFVLLNSVSSSSTSMAVLRTYCVGATVVPVNNVGARIFCGYRLLIGLFVIFVRVVFM